MLEKITRKIGSRKFFVLLIGIGVFFIDPFHFSGDNLTFLMSVYVGSNVLQKFVELKAGGGKTSD